MRTLHREVREGCFKSVPAVALHEVSVLRVPKYQRKGDSYPDEMSRPSVVELGKASSNKDKSMNHYEAHSCFPLF